MSRPTPNSARTRAPGRPRQEDADATAVRERLLDAATELAVERGFDASGLREIAARADVSPAMIAYYFGDRRGLNQAMFQRAVERMRAQVEALLDADAPPAGDRLDELMRLHVSALAADPWLPQLIVREVLASQDAGLRERFAERVGEGPLTLMVDWIAEEQARGVLRADLDPRLLVVNIVSLSVFPFLMLPVLGERLGVELDATFAGQLIEHNQKLLAFGVRVRPEEER